MQPPTVLHFLGYDEDRGGVLSAIRLIAARDSGRRHVLLVNPGFVQRRDPQLGLRFGPRVPVETIAWGSLLPAGRAAWALLRESGREEVIVHGQSRSGLLVALCLWFLGHKAVIVSPHCYARVKWFYRWAAWCLGERWCWLSPAMKRHYGVGAANWVGCIPEPASAPAGSARRTPRSGPDEVVVLGGAGTLVAWKGWHLVIGAFARLSAAERERFRFVHIGDTDHTEESRDYREQLLAAVERYGLASQFEFRGWQPDSSALLSEIDVLLVPSRDEPMALAGLEALAAGVPLLIADSGGLQDVVNPGVNALIFRTGEMDDLAERLRDLLATAFLRTAVRGRDEVGLAAVERVAGAWRARYAAVAGDGTYAIV